MRIGRQPTAADFAAKAVQLGFGNSAFQIGARVDAGRGMPLDIEQVAQKVGRGGAKEMAVARFVKGRGRRIGGDVAAHARGLAGSQHHGHGIPAQVGVQPLLDADIARKGGLARGADRVHVGGDARRRIASIVRAILLDQLIQQVMRARPAFVGQHGLHGFQPFLGFLRVSVA
ncbi:hypothetical protein D3C86_1011960 [compost metagenome]